MVNEERVSIVYNGNGKTKVFDYPYSFTEGSEIVGYVNNGKTVTRITSNSTFNSQLKKYTYPISGNAIPAGHTLMLIRKTERSNLVDLPNDSPFSAIERQFDKIARTLQEIGELDGMGKTMTVLSNDFNAIIPKGKPYAYIRFNSSATAFEVVDNPFEVGETQLKEIREIKNTIESLQRAMDKGVSDLHVAKVEIDNAVDNLQNNLNTMELQFANQLESKLSNSLDVISKQEQAVVSEIADKADSVKSKVSAAINELETVKREVIDDNLVEIRKLYDNVVSRALAASKSANEAANSASAANVSAGNASNSASSAARSANNASSSATTASNQAISAEESATRAKAYADQAADISGGHFVTNTEFDTYKQLASNNVDAAITNHNQSENAHANIVSVINNSLDLKADKIEVESLNQDIKNHIAEVISTHDISEDAHYNVFSQVAEQLDRKASKTELNTMRDNVNSQLAQKANTSDLSSKRDISNTDFTKSIAVKEDDYSDIKLFNTAGGYLRLESAPENDSGTIGSFIKRDNKDNLVVKIRLPKANGVVALEDDMRNLQALLHKFPDNTSFTNLSNVQWNQKGLFSCFIAQNGKFENQPTQYGQLINLPPSEYSNSPECAQLWIAQNGGDIWARGGNAATAVKDRAFRRLAFIDEIPNITGLLNRRYVVDSWHNPANGDYWREWSDGWCEQGAFYPTKSTSETVSYHKPFRTPPILTITSRTAQEASTQTTLAIFKAPTNTNFIVTLQRDNRQGFYWKAEGYKA